MVKEAILKAISHSLIISFLIIIPTIAPLYLITSYMTRQMEKVDQAATSISVKEELPRIV